MFSVYRFPTGNCPGYYGFAVSTGTNRTHEQISQTPTSTPTNSPCSVSFVRVKSDIAPLPATIVTAQQKLQSSEKYSRVYGRPDAPHVPLVGIGDIPKI